ncbi:DUF1206 domain-containing protein [Streptomyces sp. NPDC058646]|uniref:DUF1206 domain-containing protein n=1 Tax=Streptomyces sp. NPDC058646 TaxID=3346574 RepID=UPI003665EB63
MRRSTRSTAQSGAITVAARCGLAARGVLYVLVGFIALRIAFGTGGGEADRTGALQELSGHTFGGVLVWAVGIGLACMALWRLSEAVFGAAGPDGRKPGKRLASAGRTVFYGVVAFSVLAFAAGSGSGSGGGGGDQQSRDVTARVLDMAAGQWLVGLAGAAIAVAGVVIAVRAAMRTFRKRMDLSGVPDGVRRAVEVVGVVGGVARGAVFTAAGGFAVHAAVRFDPAQAKGIDDTLRAFADTPAGPWLLVAVAAGLMVFGVFSWAMAAWRKV